MSRKTIFKSVLLVIIMLCITNIILSTNSAVKNDNYGLSLFFSTINSNRNIIFLVVFSLLYPSILLIDYFDYDYNRFSNLIQIRIGRKKFYINSLIKVFSVYTLITLILYCLMLINIHFIWSPISFIANQHIGMYFSNNPMENMILFLIISSIGSGVYACFLYSIIYICNNKYIYRVAMILNVLVGIFASTFVVSFIRSIFTYNTFTYSLSYLLVPCGLFAPGTIPDMELSGFINFITSTIIYILLGTSLLIYSFKRREKNG